MEHKSGCVEVWRETVVIPTYGVGAPDKNPMFLEKRVYQGSSGRVYPYPVIDKILDEKRDREYLAVFLENDYLKIMLLPELGGRIQRAYDKTNGYDFVYYNEVIKPALVGLTGPWISGGIEFNWPQHHRPTTYAPTDCVISRHGDGSATVLTSEVDQMYGTKGMTSFTLYPDRAYLEIRGQLYNRTSLPQTFLWWANPAVAVNDRTMSVFPPDVHAVMDHGKRDVSRFPIATGVYYKHNYGAGVDISRYKNIPVPTSYMACHSDYDFVGGYDEGVEAGILHVADHHVSPGKKQWTWGCGDFGKAWDRNLTDANGPYIELMTGMFTDNQPDFTWLKPFEEKVFTQYFMPYKKVGMVQNANTEVVLGLELTEGVARACVYATGPQENARVTLTAGDVVFLDRTLTLSPTDILEEFVDVGALAAEQLTLTVKSSDGRLLLSHTPMARTAHPIPEPAQAAKAPEDIATCEELYLTGLHLEQYRHATYLPDDYYLEGLRRDSGDIRLNTAYGMLLLRRGLFGAAENHFRTAIKRMTWKNPNPYDSEALANLGLALLYQGRDSAAYDAFYKAAWTAEQQETAFYYLAAIACRRGQYAEALAHIDRSLVKNGHNLKALGLRGDLLEYLGQTEDATAQWKANLRLDPFDYRSRLALEVLTGASRTETLALMGARASSFVECAIDLAEAGLYTRAVSVLRLCPCKTPMLKYYEGYYLSLLGDTDAAHIALTEAAACNPSYCFPNRLEDIRVLQWATKAAPEDARAPYFLGNLWYDKRQYATAKALWERSVELDAEFPTAWRNLALVYYNFDQNPTLARSALERAYGLDTGDARVFLELDQLLKKQNVPAAERLARFDAHMDTVEKRDDLCAEYATLLNLLGWHEDAYARIMSRRFHPWEGGEGKVTRQYIIALTQMARKALSTGNPEQARALLEQALVFPENLGEGKLEGQTDNDIYYLLAAAYRALNLEQDSHDALERAAVGGGALADAVYYNDQPADMILYRGLALRALGQEENARSCFHQLIDYGERHLFDAPGIDYFAVSLPELQLFEETSGRQSLIHCHFVIGLGNLGLGNAAAAQHSFAQVLALDCSHQGAALPMGEAG